MARARTIWEGGYPVLELTINGKRARLGLDNKRTILNQYGAVFLGADFVGDVAVTIELEGRTITLRGFTDDPAIIALYRRWLAKFSPKQPSK